MNRCSFCEWIPIVPGRVWPLAGHARLGQNTVVGSMAILLSWLCWGACQEEVCLDPHFLCNLTPPRLNVELPLRERPAGAPTAWTLQRLWVPLPVPADQRARVVGQQEPWRIRRVPRGLFCPARIICLDHCTYVQYNCCYVLSPPYPRCCPEGARMAPAVATYEPRDPSRTVLYTVIADHLETFLASLDADPDAAGLPASVQREFDAYLQCGILAHGFLRLGCDTCPQELLLPFSCKRRGFCPSCAARRMAQTAAHLVECVIPWVPTRQWVVSVPVPLRYWMAASQELTAQVHTIIRTTIGQYYVNQAVTRGVPRDKLQPGSVTFMQRFGSALNLNLHFHCVFMEGVYLDRTEARR